MSAAATAAGYLYASGRLRGRSRDGQDAHKSEPEHKPEGRRIRVAALPEAPQEQPHAERPKRTPTVQYRKPRWRPDAA